MVLKDKKKCCCLTCAPLFAQDAAMRGSIRLVQVKGADSGWESMVNVWGASWESTDQPKPPLDFRIQDDRGVEVGVVICPAGQTLPFAVDPALLLLLKSYL
jgi:hypothetical protein